MGARKKTLIVLLIVSIGLFGYSQYASASEIGITITQSQLVEETEKNSTYDIQLEFSNPSLLVLTAGQTEFFVTVNDEIIGKGKLQPFVLPALGNSHVQGTFVTDPNNVYEQIPEVKISGTTKYDAFVVSIDVPFVYYPTEDQAREFIHQK